MNKAKSSCNNAHCSRCYWQQERRLKIALEILGQLAIKDKCIKTRSMARKVLEKIRYG